MLPRVFDLVFCKILFSINIIYCDISYSVSFSVWYVCKLDFWIHILWAFDLTLKLGVTQYLWALMTYSGTSYWPKGLRLVGPRLSSDGIIAPRRSWLFPVKWVKVRWWLWTKRRFLCEVGLHRGTLCGLWPASPTSSKHDPLTLQEPKAARVGPNRHFFANWEIHDRHRYS
jgi:hypothetical protein